MVNKMFFNGGWFFTIRKGSGNSPTFSITLNNELKAFDSLSFSGQGILAKVSKNTLKFRNSNANIPA